MFPGPTELRLIGGLTELVWIQKQSWMLCKKAASMIIGISMGQEICLIMGQVSLSLFF